jgi:hypothetical protein
MHVSPHIGQYETIDDANWRDHSRWGRGMDYDASANPGEQCSATGFIPRPAEVGLCSAKGSTTFPSNLIWPRETWKERIQELDKTGAQISMRIKKAFREGKWLSLNQNPTNYCWCYGWVHAMMILRMLNNEPFLRLSPYSIACIIKNYQNQGGWGQQACEKSYDVGCCTEEFWPMEKPGMSPQARSAANMNAIRDGRKYYEGSRANAALKQTFGSFDLRPRSYEEKISCLLIPMPVASGYNRIGHERCSTDAVILPNGDIGCLDLDSYTDDGDYDGKVCSSSQSLADDAVVPTVLEASAL